MEFEGLSDMRCPNCGFSLLEDNLDDDAPYPIPDEPAPSQTTQPPGDGSLPLALPAVLTVGHVPHVSDRDQVRMQGRCDDALLMLARGDRAGAREALHSALEISEDSDQVWLFLAGLAETRQEQRAALENVLACNPNNQIAIEALARLKGELAPAVYSKLEPGQVKVVQVVCPHCGGQLDYHIGQREVVCHHCGQRILDVDGLTRSGEQTALQIGLLKRKQQASAWNIGKRWLRCTSCGAITTLSRRTLTSTCRFCGSLHVVQESVNLRFEQPDFIVPFALDETQARAAITDKLRGGIRAITRFFVDAVERVDVSGVYLPFWVFDAEMVVNWSWTNAPDHGQHPALLGDVLFCAIDTLPRRLVESIEPYDLLGGVDYDPRLLGMYPAELYAIDVDRASLDVRPRLGGLAQRRVQPSLEARRPSRGYSRFGDDDSPGRLQMNASTRYMSYRLGLLPVWVARLVEEDGDTRLALVNGQTGETRLGRVEKA
jgi:DNA-directed RNA polymerase subunit RPC12/RpoP